MNNDRGRLDVSQDSREEEHPPEREVPICDAHDCKGAGCHGRRQFLRQITCIGGYLALSLSAWPTVVTGEEVKEQNKDEGKYADVVLKLSEHPALSKVGGFVIIKTSVGKIIVARTGEDTFVACAALCTHRGAQLTYEHDNKQFACPAHGARFGVSGQVARGPAKKPLPAYTAAVAGAAVDDAVVVVSLKPKEQSS